MVYGSILTDCVVTVGTNYPRLLALKKEHDPQGLFYGHHSVGSELWSADGNCRLAGAVTTTGE